MANKTMQNEWDLIYTSVEDGLSFNRLSYHILGYEAATLLIIETDENELFGAYLDTPWKESNTFYGGEDSFIFRLKPSFAIYRSIPSTKKNFMYLNAKGYALPKGVGIGGDIDNFRIFLSEDFENCYSNHRCFTFEKGRITKNRKFYITSIQAWGLGGSHALNKRASHRKETASLIDKARKVDKAQFVGSEFDKEFLLSKTFQTTQGARVVDDVKEGE